jgi:hypothetical protein
MVRHYDKFMESILFAVAIVKESFDQDFGIFRDLEDGAALPAFCRDEVRGAWRGPVLRC